MSLEKLTSEERDLLSQIMALTSNDYSQKEIAETMGVSIATVQKYQYLNIRYVKNGRVGLKINICRLESKVLRLAKRIGNFTRFGADLDIIEQEEKRFRGLKIKMDEQTVELLNYK